MKGFCILYSSLSSSFWFSCFVFVPLSFQMLISMRSSRLCARTKLIAQHMDKLMRKSFSLSFIQSICVIQFMQIEWAEQFLRYEITDNATLHRSDVCFREIHKSFKKSFCCCAIKDIHLNFFNLSNRFPSKYEIKEIFFYQFFLVSITTDLDLLFCAITLTLIHLMTFNKWLSYLIYSFVLSSFNRTFEQLF